MKWENIFDTMPNKKIGIFINGFFFSLSALENEN